jgi:putative cell wall-binding protein
MLHRVASFGAILVTSAAVVVGSTGLPAAGAAEVDALARPVSVNAAATTAEPVTRLAGPDRFSASVEISRANFDPGAAIVYVASGLNFPDALAEAPVAAKNGSPILLVATDAIPDSIKTELDRLNPGRIVVFGGVNSVREFVSS